MEIVCGVGRNVGSQAAYQIPRLLGANGEGRHCAQFVAGEEAADVDLIGGGAEEPIETIAGGEMPLWTEVVVDTGDSEIRPVRDGNIPLKADYINPIAAAAAQRTLDVTSRTVRVIANRFKLVPHLLNQRINSEASRITSSRPRRTAIGAGIQVVVYAAEGEDTGAHVGAGNGNLIGLGV